MKKLILFELRKVFSKRLALIALIGIILFSALLSFSTFQNKYAFDQNIGKGTGKTAVEIDKEIAAKYEGILTDKKVQQMMSDFAPTSDLHGLSAIYVYQNAMQSAAFSRFSDKEGNWNGLSVSDVFGNEEIKIGYVDGWLSTSRNMVRVFVALALAVIIMLAPIFSGEYEGVDNIILTSKYGKTKCATAKVVAGIITAILTTTLIAAFNLLLAFVFYGTETSVYKGYKQDKIEMRGDRAEMSDFPLYLNTVAGGLDRRDQTIGGFSFVVKIYAVPVVEIIG